MCIFYCWNVATMKRKHIQLYKHDTNHCPQIYARSRLSDLKKTAGQDSVVRSRLFCYYCGCRSSCCWSWFEKIPNAIRRRRHEFTALFAAFVASIADSFAPMSIAFTEASRMISAQLRLRLVHQWDQRDRHQHCHDTKHFAGHCCFLRDKSVWTAYSNRFASVTSLFFWYASHDLSTARNAADANQDQQQELRHPQ